MVDVLLAVFNKPVKARAWHSTGLSKRGPVKARAR